MHHYTDKDSFTITWHINDVHKHAAGYDLKLTDEQARCILAYVGANYGQPFKVSWFTMMRILEQDPEALASLRASSYIDATLNGSDSP